MAKIVNAYYNSTDKRFYVDESFSPSKVIIPTQKYRYKNIPDGRLYVWDGKSYVDSAFFGDYQYVTYGDQKYID